MNPDPPVPSPEPRKPASWWLVERMIDGRPHWLKWRNQDRCEWVTDATQADRFDWHIAAKREAQIIATSQQVECQATEHIFLDRESPSPDPDPLATARAVTEGCNHALASENNGRMYDWTSIRVACEACIAAALAAPTATPIANVHTPERLFRIFNDIEDALAWELMRQAAHDMQTAVNSFEWSLDQQRRFMDDWLARFEAVTSELEPPK